MMRFILFICSTVGFLLIIACGSDRSSNTPVQSRQELVGDTLIRFLVYGELPPSDYLDENDTLLTRPLGFELKRIADCEVTETLVKFVDERNAKMSAQMRGKYGGNWMDSIETKTGKRFNLPDLYKNHNSMP